MVLDPHKEFAPWKDGTHKNPYGDKDKSFEEKLQSSMIPSSPSIKKVFDNLELRKQQTRSTLNSDRNDLSHLMGGANSVEQPRVINDYS